MACSSQALPSRGVRCRPVSTQMSVLGLLGVELAPLFFALGQL